MAAIGSWGTVQWAAHELLGSNIDVGFNWVEIPRLQGKPALQRVGDNRTRYKIQLRTTRQLYDAFLALAASPQAYPLVVDGENQGDFVVEAIRYETIQARADGYPSLINLSVDFGEADG